MIRHVLVALVLSASALAVHSLPAAAQAQQQRVLPEGVSTSFVRLGQGVPGVFYQPDVPGENARIAVFVMHANGDYLESAACFELSQRGYRVLCANNRTNKAMAYDEGMLDGILRDAGLGVGWLRQQPGVERVVLFGHSGGGNVMSAYQMVAEGGVATCQQPERLFRCPDNLAGLPAADGVVLADSNWGQASMTLLSLDPSIVDESNGRVQDPALDLANPANGFDPAGSTYSDAFIARFQQAQGERMNRLIERAQDRLAVIEAGHGMFTDDEPFVVAGASFLGPHNRLFPQDIRLLSHTRQAWPLVHSDGSVTTEVIHSQRRARGAPAAPGQMHSGALRTTVRNFLSSYAVRTTPEYGYGADGVNGIDAASSWGYTPGNVAHFRAPLLAIGMTGNYEFLASEAIYLNSASPDKSVAFVEGAGHNFTTCTACEDVPGEFGDTLKLTFDQVDLWLSAPGRF